MIDQNPTPGRTLGRGFLHEASGRPSFPSLDRTLAIARVGSRDPASLTCEDIEDLSRAMLMHYAHMGIG